MPTHRFIARRRSAVALSTVLAVLLPLGIGMPASAADSSAIPARVQLSGRLLVLPVESETHDVAEAASPLSAETIVTLVTDEGTRVELAGEPVEGAVTGARFVGTVEVAPRVAGAVEPPASSTSALPEQVARAGADLGLPLEVVEADLVAPRSAPAPRAHRVDVMYLRPAGRSTPSVEDVDAHIARLGEFWRSESGGQIDGMARTGAVRYATLPTQELCDPAAAWDYAAGPSGFNRSPAFGTDRSSYYWAGSTSTHLLVLVPASVCGPGDGLGSIGSIHAGGVTWSSVAVDPSRWDGAVFHAVGHNLGLAHSNVTDCAHPAVEDAACEQVEYGDAYDVMGGGFSSGSLDNASHVSALNATHKIVLNALSRDGATPGLRRVTASAATTQIFTLAPAGAASGLRALEVLDPVTADRYVLEYRSGTERDADAFYTRMADRSGPPFRLGVRVLKLECGASSSCAAPASTVLKNWMTTHLDSFANVSGDVFVSRTGAAGTPGVRVEVTELTPAGATVEIRFDAALPPLELPEVTITGRASYQRELTATFADEWTTEPSSLSYRWYHAETVIPGATGPRYRVTDDDLGMPLSVRVTAKAPGFATTSTTSAPVTPTGWDTLTISGTVTLPDDAVGATLSDVRVGAASLDDAPSWMRDGIRSSVDAVTGRYTITGVPPGRWAVGVGVAEGVDLARRWYGGGWTKDEATPILVEDDIADVDIDLTRSLRLSGTLDLPEGTDPSVYEDIVVSVVGENEPGVSIPRTGHAVIDPGTGEFTVTGLDHGRYHISALGVTPTPIAVQYWPGTVHLADRGVLNVDEDISDVAFPLVGTRAIQGVVTLPEGAPAEWLTVVKVDASSTDGRTAHTLVRGDGTFRFDRLQPGSYTLCTRIGDSDELPGGGLGSSTGFLPACSGGGHVARDATPIDVTTTDAAVTLEVVRGKTITGTVSIPSGVPASARGGWVYAYPLLSDGRVSETFSRTAAIDAATGSYTMTTLTSGRYALRFAPAFGAARQGLAEVWRSGGAPLDVSSPRSGIDVAFPKAVTLSGSLSRIGLPPEGAWRSLYLVDAATGTTVLQRDRVDENFSFAGIAPGNYRLALHETLASEGNPERLQFLTAPDGTLTFRVGPAGLSGLAMTPAATSARFAGSLVTAGMPTATTALRATVELYQRDGASWARLPLPIARAWGDDEVRFTSPWLVPSTYTVGHLATTGTLATLRDVRQSWWSERPVLADAAPLVLAAGQTRTGLHGAVTAGGVTAPVLTDRPLFTQAPVLSAEPRVGVSVTARVDGWTTDTTFTYAWVVDGVTVAGATSARFTPRAQDAGKHLSVRVSGAAPGFTSDVRASPAATVAPGTLTAPAPRISGTAKVGLPLRAVPGTWTSGTSLRYQWYVGGLVVSGATQSTFTPSARHVGARVTVRVTGKATGYTSTTRLSAATPTVARASTLRKGTPTISGTRAVGATLTARPGTWTSGTTFFYQWYRQGKPIAGATARTLRLSATDRGRYITVRVAGKKPGYTTASVLSARTATIR